jgi:tRNA (guanine-N7-)-methyltransferase
VSEPPTHSRNLYYGRRRGRPLRAGQAERKTALLPQVAVTLPERGCLDAASLFPTVVREIWLEIGFGGGEHLAAQAERHPEIGFLGCEVFENGVVKLLGEVERRGLANVRIYADDARGLLAALPPRSVGRVFILFPDPWPKARHHKRRLASPAFAAEAARVLAVGGRLRFATDWADYADQALEVFSRTLGWTARRADDWRVAPADHFTTRYEAKRLGDIAPVWLEFERV